MKFLITGAYGFVGTNLCKYLVSKGHECHALDIPSARRPDVPYASFFTWDDLDQKDENVHHLSLNTYRLSLASYDCVVHLAGKAHDLKKVSSPESYFEINVGLTKKIFDSFTYHLSLNTYHSSPPPTFIYFSSIKALDGDTPYAQSKRAAEKYLEEALHHCPTPTPHSHSSSAVNLNLQPQPLSLCILQPAMIHGPGNKGNLNLLWGIAKRGIPWPLAAFENKRSFTSIGNICAIVEALALQQQPGNSATYHLSLNTYRCFSVADDAPLSTNRLIELIAETCGKRARLWRVPKSLMRLIAAVGSLIHLPLNLERLGKLTENSIVDNSAIKVALGWDTMPISAEEGLRETLKSFLSAEAEAQRLANWNMSEYRANQASHTL